MHIEYLIIGFIVGFIICLPFSMVIKLIENH
jgi:hypothetical protein